MNFRNASPSRAQKSPAGRSKRFLLSALAAVTVLGSNPVWAAPSCFRGTPTAGNSTVTLNINGKSRSFILHIPSNLPSGQAVPVVLALHYLGGTSTDLQAGTKWDATADSNKFVVAYLQGVDNAWNTAGYNGSVDDVSFFKAVVDNISTKVRVAPNRIYMTGYSLGGGMSHKMACTQADYFAATHPFIFHFWNPQAGSCSPSRPIAVQEFAGKDDTLVKYEGGAVTVAGVVVDFISAQKSFERWAAINGCTGAPTTVLTSGSNDIKQYRTCRGGVKVGLGSLKGGHDALENSGINPTANAWTFLKAHTNPTKASDACGR